MASSSSSSQNNLTNLFLNSSNTTSAPPPTPSTQSNTSTTGAADTLTRLLHRLPPTLSFPTRLSPRSTSPATTKTQLLPTISFSSPSTLTTSSFELGYFQLSPLDHLISSQLAEAAELEALSLLDLPNEQRHAFFPKDWPLGYDDDDNDDDGDHTASFCLDSRLCTTAESSLKLTSLGELTDELEKVGLLVVAKLACAMGFENPFRENGPVRSSSLMWVSLSEAEKMSKVYPFVVGLQYQIRAQKWSLGLDSGSINVEPEVGSILVTIGDIGQVWSNGKLKKVRGRPTAVLQDGAKSGSRVISMTMLLTLPLESTVSPLLLPPANITELEIPKPRKDCKEGDHDEHGKVEASNNDQDDNKDLRVFNSFSFEDYAWRVYNERLHIKDPLDRYRKLRN